MLRNSARIRLSRAREMLAAAGDSTLHVDDVAREVEMSPFHFSPSAYQRRIRTRVSVPAGLPAVLFPGCLSLMARLPPGAFSSFREAPRFPL